MAVFYHYTNSENLISIVKEEKLRCSDGAGFSANSVESVFLTRKVWNKYFLQLLFVNIQVCGYLIYYKSPGPGIVNLNSHYNYLTQQTFSSSTCPKIFRHQIHGQHKRLASQFPHQTEKQPSSACFPCAYNNRSCSCQGIIEITIKSISRPLGSFQQQPTRNLGKQLQWALWQEKIQSFMVYSGQGKLSNICRRNWSVRQTKKKKDVSFVIGVTSSNIFFLIFCRKD